MCTLMQKPGHAIHAVLLLIPGKLGVWEERPEPMRKARIEVNFGTDSRFFSKNFLINDGFVPQRIHPANLEVCGWEAFLTSLEENG